MGSVAPGRRHRPTHPFAMSSFKRLRGLFPGQGITKSSVVLFCGGALVQAEGWSAVVYAKGWEQTLRPTIPIILAHRLPEPTSKCIPSPRQEQQSPCNHPRPDVLFCYKFTILWARWPLEQHPWHTARPQGQEAVSVGKLYESRASGWRVIVRVIVGT